jgi:hypothetical protein
VQIGYHPDLPPVCIKQWYLSGWGKTGYEGKTERKAVYPPAAHPGVKVLPGNWDLSFDLHGIHINQGTSDSADRWCRALSGEDLWSFLSPLPFRSDEAVE